MSRVLSSILEEGEVHRHPDRRSFLKLGAAGLIAVAGGSVWWAERRGVFSEGAGPAYSGWIQWSDRVEAGALDPDLGVTLVQGAILAASPHNSQPWLFRLEPGQVDILADLSRNLGPVDPFLRELFMGLGCAVENLETTASGLGLATELDLFPDPNDLTLVARMTWDAEASQPPSLRARELLKAIALRHTNRGEFEGGRRVPLEILEELGRLASAEEGISLTWIREPEDRTRFGELILEATEAVIADPDQARVSDGWLRYGPDEIHRHRDGLTMDALGMGSMLTALSKMMPPPSPSKTDEFWLRATRDRHVATADVFGVLSVTDAASRWAQVACGRAWQRIQLAATVVGVAMQPLNQIPERDAREAALGLDPQFGMALSGWVAGRGQGLLCFRAGFPKGSGRPSPRRSPSEVLTEQG